MSFSRKRFGIRDARPVRDTTTTSGTPDGHSFPSVDDAYRALRSDFCSQCGSLVVVTEMILVDGRMRPVVVCRIGHKEAQ